MKILVAEDNMMNQHLMSRYMSKFGWECVIVGNGLLATEACRSDNFDIILMDIDMPVLDGIEATRYIRTFNQLIPIIAITAFTDEQLRNECAEAGMTAFIAKPFSRAEMKDVIDGCFQLSSYKVA